MLFLYRPRQTYMPYRVRRSNVEQVEYNRRLQAKFAATQRVPRPTPVPAPPPSPADDLAALKELAAMHASGALTDAEFATAKAKILS